MKSMPGAGLLAALFLIACGGERPMQGAAPVAPPRPNNAPAVGNRPPQNSGANGSEANWYDSTGIVQGGSGGAPNPTGTAPDQKGVTDALNGIFGDIVKASQASGNNNSGTTTQSGTQTTPQTGGQTTPPSTTPSGGQTTPPVQTGSYDACTATSNASVSFSNQPASRVGNKGWMRISLLAPVSSGGTPLIGAPTAVFDGSSPNSDWETGQGGYYFQGGMFRGGQKVWGTLTLTTSGSSLIAVVVLDNGGGTHRVGAVTDSGSGSSYPRLGRIDFDSGACITQYKLDSNGALISGGQGYILIP